MNNNQLDKVVKDTYRYFYIDGLVELAVGLLFVLIGLSMLGWVYTDEGSMWRVAAVLLMPVLILGGTFSMKYLVRFLKERVTFPRTGYVRYKEGEPNVGRWLVIAVALGLVIVIWFLPEWLSKIATIQGILLAVILGLIGYRVGLGRFYLLAAVALTAGIGASYLIANEIIGSLLTYVAVGGLMILMGGITLINYLRQHPTIDGHEEGMV